MIVFLAVVGCAAVLAALLFCAFAVGYAMGQREAVERE